MSTGKKKDVIDDDNDIFNLTHSDWKKSFLDPHTAINTNNKPINVFKDTYSLCW
jgi:hypothetical protein